MLRQFLAQCSAKRQKLELQVHATNTRCAALNSHNERIVVEISELRILVRLFLLAISFAIVKHTRACCGTRVPFHHQPPCPLAHMRCRHAYKHIQHRPWASTPPAGKPLKAYPTWLHGLPDLQLELLQHCAPADNACVMQLAKQASHIPPALEAQPAPEINEAVPAVDAASSGRQ